MKFATIGHLRVEEDIHQFPKSWIQGDLAVSPELNIHGTRGYITGLLLTARQMMELPQNIVRKKILDAAVFVQNSFGVDLIQLGALTTSVTDGGVWVTQQTEYTGFVNHGDSYTAAVTCQTVMKALTFFHKESSDEVLAIVGAYGVIGEAVSKILVTQFKQSILIGRKEEKLNNLKKSLQGNFSTTVDLNTIRNADIVVTATSHPTALLRSEHLKKHVIVVDVSQPPNLSYEVCQQRPDVCRIDGGLVDFPAQIPIPGMPVGKNFACIVEVIMQAMEDERKNHAGSIDLKHLRKTEKWGEKYGFTLKELTNFGKTITRTEEKNDN